MQVGAAALQGASDGDQISTALLKKANDLQSQDLQLVNPTAQAQTPNLPGMGTGVSVTA